MGIFETKFGKRKKEVVEVNDALIKMEKLAAQMATASGNKVMTNICERRIQELRTENRNLKKGLA